jgi:phytoene desaturase
MKTAVIIGSGFAGLSAAAFMAKYGWKVTVLEKNSGPGGRARQLLAEGFAFDMGPSWYWMPDVFERFFGCFGKKTSTFYPLHRLDPSYRVFWPDSVTDIPADLNALKDLFERWEPGTASKLDAFLKEAAFKYKTGIDNIVHKPGLSVFEFMDRDLLKGVFRMDVFTSMKKHVAKYFKDPRIRQLMEFPVLFLGALPEHTPALYSLMNYADIVGGTWYPQGGMYSVVAAMHKLAMELGADFHFNEEVTSIKKKGKKIDKVLTGRAEYSADVVIAGADYNFVEQQLLSKPDRTYDKSYWESRQMAPSCLIYYVGINKRLNHVRHHNLFFDTDFSKHGNEIYSSKSWPDEPLFYLSVNSLTDRSVAPEGCENLFFLIPIASGLTNETETLHEKYFDMIINRFEQKTGEQIRAHIVYKKSYGPSDFVTDYHAFKGNAYGLANTLKQTAILKPKCRSNKINNLYYTGQLTVPGPGVPPSLISGEIVAGLANAEHQKSSV